jgi:hypothetical protein
MGSLEWFGGTLHVLDPQDTIVHEFERGSLSRAEYMWVAHWIRTRFDERADPSELWNKGLEAWKDLSVETKSHLFIIDTMEVQNANDIRTGLLATLAGYQGLPSIKKLFIEALEGVII